MKQHPTLTLGLWGGVLLLCGCGGGTQRTELQGAATFDGKPIVYGEVEFLPDLEKGPKDALAGSAEIRDGKYSTSENGQGIQSGPYKLRITAYPSVPPVSEDETVVTTPVEPLFVGYSMNAEITGSTYDIAVPAEAAGFNYLEGSAPKRRGNVP